MLGRGTDQLTGVKAVDPLKVLITMDGLGLNGIQMANLLHTEYHIELEIAQPHMVMAMFSLLHSRDAWEHFYRAVAEIAARYPSIGKKLPANYFTPPWHMILPPVKLLWRPRKRSSWKTPGIWWLGKW